MRRRSQRTTYILFAVLGIYILLQFIWWAILLVQKDEMVVRLAGQVEILGGVPPDIPSGPRAMRMIVGEGLVFMLIVLAVLYLTWRAIRRDLDLARTQRNFLLAVTHELRSPIAAIKLQLQTLGKHELDLGLREQLLAQAVQETDRLSQLTEKVLHSTSAEERSKEPDLLRVEIMGLMHDLLERSRLHLAPHHQLILEGPDRLERLTDPGSIQTILENLIENAAKYAPEGSRILVEITGRREGWRMSVCDEGPGIKEEERERIFEKFYRSGNEETRAAKGTGLGLYIVKHLVEKLGGAISVKTRKPHGSIFVASFPNH